MDSDSGGSDDSDMEIEIGSDSSSNTQLVSFVVTNIFSNE